MAWQCSGKTNTELITKMCQRGVIRNARVRNAMLNVDRAQYTPSRPYEDAPQPIGWGATISAPHMHSSAVEALLPFLRPGARVLDIGSGSGYLTAILAELALDNDDSINKMQNLDEENKMNRTLVVGVEHIKPLRELGEKNFAKSVRGRQLLSDGTVRFVEADGRKGWHGDNQDPDDLGWDAIHVGAAAKGLHKELVEQLRRPGRLFIPVEDQESEQQWIWIVDKGIDGEVKKVRKEGVRYVPLTDAPVSP